MALYIQWLNLFPSHDPHVRDLDAVIEKLNTTFQQDLKDEVEAQNFFLN